MFCTNMSSGKIRSFWTPDGAMKISSLKVESVQRPFITRFGVKVGSVQAVQEYH